LSCLQAEAISAEPAEAGAPCGEPLPYLINELPAYPANPGEEYAFRVEPFAPCLTFVPVRGPPAGGGAGREGGWGRAGGCMLTAGRLSSCCCGAMH
jgi:hypothetical protein